MKTSIHGYILVRIEIQEEDGQFAAYCPELGTATCGDSFEEAKENIKEAIQVDLDTLTDLGEIKNFFKKRNIHVYQTPQEVKKPRVTLKPGVYTTMQALPT